MIGTASIGEDITDRKRMEEELKQSEERFRMVVESAPDAIFVRSVSGHFVYLNRAAVDLFGAASADQLIGMHIRDRIPRMNTPRSPIGLSTSTMGTPFR